MKKNLSVGQVLFVSTSEARPKGAECLAGIKKEEPSFAWFFFFYGAADEARTRYLHLGKVALYQMSYSRILYRAELISAIFIIAKGRAEVKLFCQVFTYLFCAA